MRQTVLRKKSFIPALAEQTGLTEEQAEKFYQIVFESIKWALSRGYSVNIENFGTFKPKYFAERTWTHNVENKDGESRSSLKRTNRCRISCLSEFSIC